MILITGGAGFIGSNLQAALARRGHETVVVDTLGSHGKWRNLAKHPPTRVVHPDDLDAFLNGRPPVEMVFHLGAVSETTAVDGDHTWATNVELSRRCGNGAPIAACAWSMRPRPRPTATARSGFDDEFSVRRAGAAAAAEPVWLDQARLRPAGRAHAADAAGAAAAMGRAEVLQRLRPERISQGQDDLGREGQARRGRRRRSRPAVQVRPAGPGGRRAGARLHLGRRRGRRDALADGDAVGQRPVQPGHRQRAHLPGPGAMRSATRRASRARCEFIDMPDSLRGQYQSFTQAPMDRLRAAGYARPVHPAGGRHPALRAGPSGRRRTCSCDPRPAVSAVRPGHRPVRAAGDPLVRAGLHHQPGDRLAPGAALRPADARRSRRRCRSTTS